MGIIVLGACSQINLVHLCDRFKQFYFGPDSLEPKCFSRSPLFVQWPLLPPPVIPFHPSCYHTDVIPVKPQKWPTSLFRRIRPCRPHLCLRLPRHEVRLPPIHGSHPPPQRHRLCQPPLSPLHSLTLPRPRRGDRRCRRSSRRLTTGGARR